MPEGGHAGQIECAQGLPIVYVTPNTSNECKPVNRRKGSDLLVSNSQIRDRHAEDKVIKEPDHVALVTDGL